MASGFLYDGSEQSSILKPWVSLASALLTAKIQNMIGGAFKEEERVKSLFTSQLHIWPAFTLAATFIQAHRGLIDV